MGFSRICMCDGFHTRYLIRELRILAYTQFLDAYKSVVMGTMATAFGVGEPFLDKELSRFIAAGRLNAKIDKVWTGREGGRERGAGGTCTHFIHSLSLETMDLPSLKKRERRTSGFHRGGVLIVACLSRLTVYHAPRSRRSTVPTSNRDTSNSRALVT